MLSFQMALNVLSIQISFSEDVFDSAFNLADYMFCFGSEIYWWTKAML